MQPILRDNRHLISEMACKSFGDDSESESVIRQALKEAYEEHRRKGGGFCYFSISYSVENCQTTTLTGRVSSGCQWKMSLRRSITSEEDFDKKFGSVADKFFAARKSCA